MRVQALVSFAGTIEGVKYHCEAGDDLDLPEGADWLEAGLVIPLATIPGEDAEAATAEAPEKRTRRKKAKE